MTSRRQLLRGVAGSLSVFGGLRWGGLVAPADAQANEPASDSNASDDDNDSSDADEGDPTGLPGYTVSQIYLRYEEHVGITTFVELENQGERNHERVQLETDARGPNETMGSDQTWENIPITFTRSVKLRIDNVFELYNAVDNITEFVIRGRLPGGESDVIAVFSGSRFQTGIETDGPTKPDGGTDAAVTVQQETETDGAAADETTANGDTDDTTQSGDETTGGDEETAADETTGTETADDEGDPADQPGVDISNPEDVVSAGGNDEGDTEGSDDDGGEDDESDGGGGLLQSLSFGLLGG